MPRNPEANFLPCVFSLALTRRMAACELATALPAVAAPVCSSPLARTGCAGLYGLLRERASFVLKHRPGHTGPLASSMALRVQCGGLLGLKAILDPDAQAPDVHRLVRLAQQYPGGPPGLPATILVREISVWRDAHLER